MVKYDNSYLVLWIEKVKDYVRVEPIFINDSEEINKTITVSKVIRLKKNEEKFLFYIIYYLCDRYGIEEVIQSNYLITDKDILNKFDCTASNKKHFQDEEIINITDEDIKNMLYNNL
ncbi:MAG: hypothetical protein E7172_05735 [Firmicutes bacterium]|nr:hypothetical protein [Bacillota bacterium]